MAKKVAVAALQYSKWLSKYICGIWAAYRFAALIATVIRPEAAEALASTLYNLDWIMLVNEGTYLINSLGEKYIYSDRFIFKWLETGGFKQLVGRVLTVKKQAEEVIEEELESEQEIIEEELQAEAGDEDGNDDSCG